jgi:hypothetical protein
MGDAKLDQAQGAVCGSPSCKVAEILFGNRYLGPADSDSRFWKTRQYWPPGHSPIWSSNLKPACCISDMTTLGGTPCPPRLAGTPATGKNVDKNHEGSKSMTARRPCGRRAARRLRFVSAGLVMWWYTPRKKTASQHPAGRLEEASAARITVMFSTPAVRACARISATAPSSISVAKTCPRGTIRDANPSENAPFPAPTSATRPVGASASISARRSVSCDTRRAANA